MTNNKYGSAPIFVLSEELRKQWIDIDPTTRKMCEKNLHEFTERMSLENSITVLANVLMDVIQRLEKLEKND